MPGMEGSILARLLDWLDMETPGLEPGGYLAALLQRLPAAYCLGLAVSLGAVLAAWNYTREQAAQVEEEGEKEQARFEISPGDECEFVPLSAEEDAGRRVEDKPYIPLDPDHPGRHIMDHLAELRGEDEEGLEPEDLAKYLSPRELHVLEDPRESPSRKGSLISRVKKARQRALRNAVERDMTADDRMRETMAASQSLARVYSVMRENKELFGDTSFDDVQAQMELYKA